MSPGCCVGCHPNRCCVCVLEAVLSVPEIMPSQPKTMAASSGERDHENLQPTADGLGNLA